MKLGQSLLMTLLVIPVVLRGLTVVAQGNAPSRLAGSFSWELSPPFITPENTRAVDPERAVKDPSVVYDDGKWHVFMSYKSQGHTGMEYVGFDKWENADKSPRTILRSATATTTAPPRSFFTSPEEMVPRLSDGRFTGSKKMWLAYSTTTTIADPTSWTKAQPMLDGSATDPRKEGGIDYWMISDDQRAYFFYTNDHGMLWRMWTPLKDFPNGLDHPEVALGRGTLVQGRPDAHRLKGANQYLAIIEARGHGDHRYFKAYVADRLDGKWTGLADTEANPFAGAETFPPQGEVSSGPTTSATANSSATRTTRHSL